MTAARSRRAALPRPADYYAGAPGWVGDAPRNILAFRRTDSREAAAEGIQMHPRHVLCLCLGGAGVLTVEGRMYRLRPGQGFLLFPFQQHHLADFEVRAIDWLFISCDLAEGALLAPLRDRPFAVTPRARVFVGEVVAAFRGHLEGRAHRAADITAWLMLLLAEQAGAAAGRALPLDRVEQPGAARLRKAVRHIYANLDQPFRIDACARAASLSAVHLRRLFRQGLGCSLGRYVRQARVHRASSLLHLTDLNVTEIAEACGFGSVYAFSRTFAEMTGHPPTEQRARLRRTGLARPGVR